MVSRDIDDVQQPWSFKGRTIPVLRCRVVVLYSKSNLTPHVTPLWPHALNICNRCEGFASHWLLLSIPTSFFFPPVSSVRRYVCPSRPLLLPSLFLSSVPSQPPSIFTHLSSSLLSTLLVAIFARSFLFDSSHFPLIATLLYTPSRPSYSLVDCSNLLLDFGKAVSPNVKTDLFRTRNVCNDITVGSLEARYLETAKLFAQ